MPTPMDKYELYERAAQSPTMQARFLRALYGGGAESANDDCKALVKRNSQNLGQAMWGGL